VLTRASGALLQHSVLLTRARALEAFERASEVIFDKTGTLTFGRLTMARVNPLAALSAEDCIAFAAALESGSRHPVARAFATGAIQAAARQTHVPGEGIEGWIGERRLRIGSARFCASLCPAPLPELCAIGSDHTRVFLCDQASWLAAFDLEDTLRPEAAELVEYLRSRNILVHLVSGDDPSVVAVTARRLGITVFAGGVTPEGKLDYLRRRQRAGRVIVMVGDGLNDAPVLAHAEGSIAMGGGAAAAQQHADAVIMGNSLGAVRGTFELAQRALSLIRQDLAWALAYNAVALPLAATGWIGPWEAALGMAASSAAVLLNSLRSLRPRSAPEAWKASTSSFPSPSPSYS
jgi:Cu2+-exporting ATPase